MLSIVKNYKTEDIFPDGAFEVDHPLPPPKDYNKERWDGYAIQQWDWFEEADIPDFHWLCSTLGLCPGPISILSAFSNTGKTFWAAALAICVANGLNFLGDIVIDDPGKVIHIDWDQGQKFSKIYYWRLLQGFGLKSFQNINYIQPNWHLHDKEAYHNLIGMLTGHKLCIIDCLGSAIPEADINDDRVRSYIDMLNRVSEITQCSILMLHHEPKTTGSDPLKSVKGNGSIISAAGGSIHLSRDVDSDIVEWQLGKKRLVKSAKGQCMLVDCGEYSQRLKMTQGLLLKKIEEEVKDPIFDLLLSLQFDTLNNGELKKFIKMKNDKKDELIKQCIENKYIDVAAGAKNSKTYSITNIGKEYIAKKQVDELENSWK